MEIIFNYPQYLWFLISIPLLAITHLFVLRFVRKKAMRFANFEALERVVSTGEHGIVHSHLVSKNIMLLISRLLILTMIILSISGMVLWYEGKASRFDYVIAIDSSSSMLATDLSPDRFSVAKDSAISFLDLITYNSNVGLVQFSGTSVMISPVTDMIDELKEEITGLRILQVAGTDLGQAIYTSINILPMNSNRPGVIILMTDGQSNVGAPLERAISYAMNRKVTVHTIGIGTKEGGTFIQGGLSQLAEEELKNIAEKTNGKYFLADSSENLQLAFREIAEINTENVPLDLSAVLIFFALSLMFVEWGLVNTKFRTLP
jgi:Ca-activated chloride channel family protein